MLIQKNSIFFQYLELCKPRITFFCLMMTLGGMVLASNKISIWQVIMTFIGVTFSVASANTLNMVYERNSDKFMQRTQFRPMVTGRIKVYQANFFALILACLSMFILSYFVNILTASLAMFALLFYAAIYTPLKSKTPLALVIGAIPGAIPPLLGSTAVDNRLTLTGIALFTVLFAWQMPHFIAISIYHLKDYTKAGIKVVPAVRGIKVAKIQALLWSIILFLSTLWLVYLKMGGAIYFIFAVILGTWYLGLSIQGFRKSNVNWARKFFLASLIYLPVLVLGLIIDRCVHLLL